MNKPTQLIVPFNKNNIKQARIILPIMILIILILLFIFSQINLSYISSFSLGFYIIFFMKGILYFALSLFALGTVYTFFIKSTTPAAIFNQKGIWIKNYGFSSWKNVSKINLYSLPTARHIELIGIQVKDASLLFKQASWKGKCGLFWAKLFGYYHITLSNIDIENDNIISFARQYIKPKFDN